MNTNENNASYKAHEAKINKWRIEAEHAFNDIIELRLKALQGLSIEFYRLHSLDRLISSNFILYSNFIQKPLMFSYPFITAYIRVLENVDAKDVEVAKDLNNRMFFDALWKNFQQHIIDMIFEVCTKDEECLDYIMKAYKDLSSHEDSDFQEDESEDEIDHYKELVSYYMVNTGVQPYLDFDKKCMWSAINFLKRFKPIICYQEFTFDVAADSRGRNCNIQVTTGLAGGLNSFLA